MTVVWRDADDPADSDVNLSPIQCPQLFGARQRSLVDPNVGAAFGKSIEGTNNPADLMS